MDKSEIRKLAAEYYLSEESRDKMFELWFRNPKEWSPGRLASFYGVEAEFAAALLRLKLMEHEREEMGLSDNTLHK
jgi:hypothetical protein